VYTDGVFGREITKYTVTYFVHIYTILANPSHFKRTYNVQCTMYAHNHTHNWHSFKHTYNVHTHNVHTQPHTYLAQCPPLLRPWLHLRHLSLGPSSPQPAWLRTRACMLGCANGCVVTYTCMHAWMRKRMRNCAHVHACLDAQTDA